MSVLGLCLEMSFCLTFARHLPYVVASKTPHARALQKVRGSLTWWWHLILLHCITITLSQSLVLVFFCLFLRTSLLTSFLISSHLSLMCIRIWQPIFSYHVDPSPLLHPHSWLPLFHHYGCHQHWFCSTKRGPILIETAMDGDGCSCFFCCSSLLLGSFHLCSFFFGSWCDLGGHYGAALAHGCSPWLSHWWDVSDEHPCRPYST